MRKSRGQGSEGTCPRYQVRSGRPLVTSLCMTALLYQQMKSPLPSRQEGHSCLQGGTMWRVKRGEDCSIHPPFQLHTPVHNLTAWISGPFPLCSAVYKLMSIESVMLSNHLILCHPLPFSSWLPSFPTWGRRVRHDLATEQQRGS